jgi:hypothetical protein
MLAVGLVVWHSKPAEETADGTESATAKAVSMNSKPSLPGFPPPVQQPVAAVVPPQNAIRPPADAARAWTLRASTTSMAPTWTLPGQHPERPARWPEVWRLPQPASPADHRLASLGDAEAGQRLWLNTAAAEFPPGTNIATIAELESTTKPPVGVGETLAGVRLDGPDIVLSWAAPQREAKLASQLMNCLVEMSDGKQKRVAQLREPVRAEPIAMELTADKQQVETQIPNPPRGNTLQLEVTELVGFSSEPQLRGGVRATGQATAASAAMTPGVPPGAMLPSGAAPGMGMQAFGPMPVSGRIVIDFPEIPGLEIHVAFQQESGKAIVSVDPKLREDGKEGELSLRRIAQIEEEAKRPLGSAQRDLDSAERSLKVWSEKLKDSKATEPPSTSRRFAAWQLKHFEATRNVGNLEKSVTDLSARIDKSKNRLDLAAKLRTFLKDSNKQAAIHYVVYSECGETDLLLVDARGRR